MGRNQKKIHLDERSILADRFVPQELRAINSVTVTTPLSAVKLPAVDTEALSHALVPPIPSCRCSGEKHPNKDLAPIRHVTLEIRYALPPIISAKNEVWPKVEGIGDLEGYCKTWEKLLWEERRQILFIYERYSQYNLPISVKPSGGGRGLIAQFSIAGISDARPSLDTGDTVLFRPMRPISLPAGPSHWSPASHTVEIDAHVLLTQRMDKKVHRSTDQVVTTWLDPLSHATLDKTYALQRYNVRFIPSVKLYERCLSALDWIKTLSPKLAMDLLFPNQAPTLPSLKEKGKYGDLNDKQSNFVDMVRLRTSHPSMDTVRPPMLLTGPAGTGKTKTLLKTILEVLKQQPQDDDDDNTSHDFCTHRILVCTPSHTAADVVTTRLGAHLPPASIFRLFDTDRPVETVPVGLLQYCRQDKLTGTFSLPSPKELYGFQVIICTCSDAHLLYRAGFTNAQLRTRRRCFQTFLKHTIPECNLRGGAIEGVDEPHFTHLFIDEAAQATEPETLIPMSVVVDPLPGGNRKVEIVLVGDPRQLSPNVYCTKAAESGLSKSFLERLLQRPVNALGGGHPHMLGPPPNLQSMQDWIQYSFQKEGQDYLSVFLTYNYRGHASFLMMPSTLFYFDKLQSAKTNGNLSNTQWIAKLREIESLSSLVILKKAKLPEFLLPQKQSSWPIHFRGVCDGKDVSVAMEAFTGAANSWSNHEEAHVVVEIVRKLHASNVSSQSIGVMAPFRAQVVLIRKLLREVNLGGVNVGTIEDYQAVERHVIILSLTRSNSKFVASDVERRMGVFSQPKRTNVATTRAEHLFIVVGNPVAMSRDIIWRQWLFFFLRNGLWYDDDDGEEFLKRFKPSAKPYRSVLHRAGLESSAQFVFTKKKAGVRTKKEDDIVTISSLERCYAPRDYNDSS